MDNTVSNNKIAQAIFFTLQNKNDSELPSLSRKVVQFLAKRRLLGKVPDILACLKRIMNQHYGILDVKVFSARKLEEEVKNKINNFLQKYYKFEKIQIEEKLDPSLLGGWRLEIDSEVIDLSFRNKLKKLQKHLENI
jgi:F-type H+-transporting ATPase subunit delta